MGPPKDVEDGFTNIAFEEGDLEASHQYGMHRKQSVASSEFSTVTISKSGKKYRIRRSSADKIPRTIGYRVRKALLITAMAIGIFGLALFFIIRHEVHKDVEHPHVKPHPPIEGHQWESPYTKAPAATVNMINVTRNVLPSKT